MKIYELSYFDGAEWAHMTADVVADDPEQAKELLLKSGEAYVCKRGSEVDPHAATLEEKMTWVKHTGDRPMPQIGLLSIRKTYD